MLFELLLGYELTLNGKHLPDHVTGVVSPYSSFILSLQHINTKMPCLRNVPKLWQAIAWDWF